MSRLFIVTAAVLVCGNIASSREPLAGTWDLDRAQTNFDAGASPQEQVLTIQKQGSNFLYTVIAASPAGPQVVIKYTVAIRGGEGKFLIGNYDRVLHKRINGNTREAHYFREGKEVMSFQGLVTKEATELRITVRGTDAQGKPIIGLSVYTRRRER